MQHINLTKKAVGDRNLMLSPDRDYLTNGHWAAKRDLFKQAALLGSTDALKAMFPKANVQDDPIPADHWKQVQPKYKAPVEYYKTSWIKDGGGGYRGSDSVLFQADDGSQMWIDRDFVKLFDLEVVTSESCPNAECLDPGRVGPEDDWSVLVMPKRIGFEAAFRVEEEESKDLAEAA